MRRGVIHLQVLAAIILCLLLFVPHSVSACPSCYGASDAPMTQGMNMAILSLLGVTGGVLVAFVSFFVYLRKRARALMAGGHIHTH
jgi:heme/copper-type cytochrome/quinol oxidase subunit 2